MGNSKSNIGYSFFKQHPELSLSRSLSLSLFLQQHLQQTFLSIELHYEVVDPAVASHVIPGSVGGPAGHLVSTPHGNAVLLPVAVGLVSARGESICGVLEEVELSAHGSASGGGVASLPEDDAVGLRISGDPLKIALRLHVHAAKPRELVPAPIEVCVGALDEVEDEGVLGLALRRAWRGAASRGAKRRVR
jgi:hypothetical protein